MNIEKENYIRTEASDMQSPDIVTLWKRYNFPGNPPHSGSVAEGRMLQYAEEYLDCVIGKATKKEVASAEIQHSSEKLRRDLHNKLSIMIFGVVRDDLREVEANKVSEFATELFYPGYTFKQLEDGAYKEEVTIN